MAKSWIKTVKSDAYTCRVIVCGGRTYKSAKNVEAVILGLREVFPNLHVIHGGAMGADSLAEKACMKLGIPFTRYPAYWTKYGKIAGVLRNARMLKKNWDAYKAKAEPVGHTITNKHGITLTKGADGKWHTSGSLDMMQVPPKFTGGQGMFYQSEGMSFKDADPKLADDLIPEEETLEMAKSFGNLSGSGHQKMGKEFHVPNHQLQSAAAESSYAKLKDKVQAMIGTQAYPETMKIHGTTKKTTFLEDDPQHVALSDMQLHHAKEILAAVQKFAQDPDNTDYPPYTAAKLTKAKELVTAHKAELMNVAPHNMTLAQAKEIKDAYSAYWGSGDSPMPLFSEEQWSMAKHLLGELYAMTLEQAIHIVSETAQGKINPDPLVLEMATEVLAVASGNHNPLSS